MNRFFLVAIFVWLAAAVSGAVHAADDSQWLGTWGTAPQLTETRNLPPPPGLTSNTLRQVVRVSVGGKKLRVHFSNAFGNGPVTMKSVYLALSAGGGAIKTETQKLLTFDGKQVVTIPAGQTTTSDPLDFDLAPLAEIAVTICFGQTPTDVTGHPGSRSTSYLQTGNAASPADMPDAARTQHWYFLTGMDVPVPATGAAVITLGDSITDGRGSEPDKNNRWPNDLANRLQADAATKNIAVLNEGIGGNCVLRGGLGPTARSRFDCDVLGQDSVRWLIVLEGVNDIGGSHGTNSTVAQDLAAAYAQLVEKAHAKHIRVFGATITPFGKSFYDSPAHEAARQAVNEMIRNGGKFDAVIDFDAALRDPQNPDQLLPAADSGDHLHPGVKGYQMMADAIDLKLFEN